jgi:hypothetical protein
MKRTTQLLYAAATDSEARQGSAQSAMSQVKKQTPNQSMEQVKTVGA